MVQSKKRLSTVIYLKAFVFGQVEPFDQCNLLYATGSFTTSANVNAHQKRQNTEQNTEDNQGL